MSLDRRTFLRRLARAAPYTAPVVTTLATPRGLAAILLSPMGMGMGMGVGMGVGGGMDMNLVVDPPSAPPPWEREAPWRGDGAGGE